MNTTNQRNVEDLDFKGGNPGAVRYGNFINYYQFHPANNRLQLLPSHIWKNTHFHGLDLGCNAGNLTLSIYNFLQEKTQFCEILGVDIDPVLIQRAQGQMQNESITFSCLDIMNPSDKIVISNYKTKRKIEKFSCVFCFSLTMWIHLNNGDSGLKAFLAYIADLGELLVIEPQPWKCYKSAIKRLKQSGFEFPHYKDLKIRQSIEEDIENYLVEHCKAIKYFESERSSWGRKLLVFQCPTNT